jgi:hypothetical protein
MIYSRFILHLRPFIENTKMSFSNSKQLNQKASFIHIL